VTLTTAEGCLYRLKLKQGGLNGLTLALPIAYTVQARIVSLARRGGYIPAHGVSEPVVRGQQITH
jgi:hypothetical protein